MSSIRLNWFEIPVSKLDRARKFYETVLDVSLNLSDRGTMEMALFPMSERNVPGPTGALVKADGYVPSKTGTLVYFSVPDIEAVLVKVNATGGKTVLLKTPIGVHGFIAQFTDSEGNKIGLHTPPVQ